MYRVIKSFRDLQDNLHIYAVGDVFPREGANVLPSRYRELASTENKQGTPLIEEIKTENKPARKRKAKE